MGSLSTCAKSYLQVLVLNEGLTKLLQLLVPFIEPVGSACRLTGWRGVNIAIGLQPLKVGLRLRMVALKVNDSPIFTEKPSDIQTGIVPESIRDFLALIPLVLPI